MTLDAQILSALRQASGSGISGSALSQKLGISRTAVWARIQELRNLGYDIAASPHLGYKLVAAPDVLHGDDILALLGSTRIVGRDIRVFQETTSTNNVMEKLARDGVREGVVIMAESQTRGRGRLGRSWVSPPCKGLWFSVLLRPQIPPHAVTRITIAAATALARAIAAETGLRPEIKWPNDVLIRGRKTAGILTELAAELDTVNYVILGIGVDVNLNASDFPSDLRDSATSLRLASRHPINRAELAARILKELDRDYDRVCRGQFEAVADEWEAGCTTLGKDVIIRTGATHIEGRAEALDLDGALLLRTQHGHLERVIGGDLSLQTQPPRGPLAGPAS